MAQTLAGVTLVVHDYDEAIAYYTTTLGFTLLEDTPLAGGKRWVRVAPSAGSGAELLLARAATSEQAERVGNQTGHRVAFFLHTDDFFTYYQHLQKCGVTFESSPREEAFGTAVVFSDIYGNRWDLIGRRKAD